jgi:hypothetical protein
MLWNDSHSIAIQYGGGTGILILGTLLRRRANYHALSQSKGRNNNSKHRIDDIHYCCTDSITWQNQHCLDRLIVMGPFQEPCLLDTYGVCLVVYMSLLYPFLVVLPPPWLEQSCILLFLV